MIFVLTNKPLYMKINMVSFSRVKDDIGELYGKTEKGWGRGIYGLAVLKTSFIGQAIGVLG